MCSTGASHRRRSLRQTSSLSKQPAALSVTVNAVLSSRLDDVMFGEVREYDTKWHFAKLK